MSVYAHRDDKSKHKLGDESELNGIGNGTAFSGIRTLYSQLRANNKNFQFAYSGGKYGYTVDGTFYPFKNPVGTMSITANGNYNIADYASVNVAVLSIQYIGTFTRDTVIDISSFPKKDFGNFIAVVEGNVEHGETYDAREGWTYAKYYSPTISISGNSLSLRVGKLGHYMSSMWPGELFFYPSGGTKLYYIG
jgi:hypothetical protein